MGAISGQKDCVFPDYPQVMSQIHCTPASIATQAQRSIRIIIHHLEVIISMQIKQDESIGPDAKFTVTQAGDEGMILSIKNLFPIVNHHKIISCTLVFIEFKQAHGFFFITNLQ
jgi:hypothetical protein